MKKSIFILVALLLITMFGFSEEPGSAHIFKYKGYFGIFDDDYKIIEKPTYLNSGIYKCDDNVFSIARYGGNELLNISGKELDPVLKNAKSFHKTNGNWIYFRPENSNYVFYNSETKVMVESSGKGMDDASANSPYLCDGMRYLSAKDGSVVNIEECFPNVFPMEYGAALKSISAFKRAIIDEKGNVIRDDIIDSGLAFHEGLMLVETEDGKCGYINPKGEYVINIESFVSQSYDSGPKVDLVENYPFSEGVAVIQIKPGIYRIIDKTGKVLMSDTKFNWCSEKQNGLIQFRKNEEKRYGFMDSTGKVIISPIFGYSSSFVDGYCQTTYEGKDVMLKPDGTFFYTEDLVKGNGIKFVDSKSL